ncbi:hypothetical protein LCGC14_2388810 [marine sediment metagenome]|uniref:DUF4238 domain-containing protein n=1 Tax=marine sediment metagenome TaxID=412755 RepID=A0A0F9EB18_9ZZZZ
MAKQPTKHTHIVQKEYLKNFSFVENSKPFIWRFNKATGTIKKLPIKVVAVENYFYPQMIEEWLANEIESKGIALIKRIIDNQSIDFLNESEKEAVARWMLVQDLRTREYRHELKFGFEAFTKLIVEKDFIPHQYPELKEKKFSMEIDEQVIKELQMGMMKRFEKLAPVIAKYHWCICINNTGKSYFTSDHPIVKDNSYINSIKKLTGKKVLNQGLGYFSEGIEIQLPLSPELCLILYDLKPLGKQLAVFDQYPQFKSLYPKHLVDLMTSPKKQAVEPNIVYFNEHITAFSNKYIFSKDNDFSIAKNFLSRNLDFKKEDRIRLEIN